MRDIEMPLPSPARNMSLSASGRSPGLRVVLPSLSPSHAKAQWLDDGPLLDSPLRGQRRNK